MAEGPAYGTPDGLFATPLGAIAPARPTGEEFDEPFRAEISPDGAKHPVTRGLAGGDANPPAWGRWLRQIGGEATGGATLMQGVGNSPLLVLNRVDKGRVALLLSDQMWLWARGFDGGGPYLDLLRRLAHWLMKEPDLEEEALRARASGRDLTIERQSLKGEVAAGDGDRAGRQDADAAACQRRARAVARDAQRRRGRALSRQRRRAHRAGGGRAAEPGRIPGRGVDAGEAEAARRGDRRRRPSPRPRRRRRDRPAARRGDAAVAELFRLRLHRDQARRSERVDRRQADAARRRLLRPGPAVRRLGVGVAARGRRAR